MWRASSTHDNYMYTLHVYIYSIVLVYIQIVYFIISGLSTMVVLLRLDLYIFTECMSTDWTVQLPDLLLILHVYKLIELSNCLTCCSSNKSINWLNCPNCLMCCSSNKSINWLPWSCNKSINWLSWSPGLGLIMYILTTLDFPTHKLTTSVNAKYYYLQTDWTVQLLGLLLIQHVTIAV